MRIIFLVLILSTISSEIICQNISVFGFVTDSLTGEKLVGANITCKSQNRGTQTNSYGYYNLIIEQTDSIDINYSFVGFTTKTIKISGIKDIQINISLFPGYILNEINVVAGKSVQHNLQNNISSISVKEIKTLPSLGGENDLIKSFQLLPGVQSGNESSSGLYVRGGSPDQNLIVIDDVPIYYINHLGGFISIFNSDAINKVSLIKGNYPPKYGGRLSSILDVRLKEGNLKELHANGTIGLVSSKITIEGPIKKDTSSFIISARRFLYDLISRPLTRLTLNGSSVGYTFYDLNVKINYKFSLKDRIYLSFYSGDDKSTVTYKNTIDDYEKSKGIIKWGNMLSAFRWNHLYTKDLFGNLTVSFTRFRFITSTQYKYDSSEGKHYYSGSFLSSVNDFSAKYDLEYSLSSRNILSFGVGSIFHYFNPFSNSFLRYLNNTEVLDTTYCTKRLKSWEHHIYFNQMTKPLDFLTFNIGGRTSVYTTEGEHFAELEPRLSLQFYFNKIATFNVSYSIMHQYVNLLTYTNVGIPIDLWMPTTLQTLPSYSSQITTGISIPSIANLLEINIDFYLKKMKNLIAYKEGATILGSSHDWQEMILSDGIGCSKGFELLLKFNHNYFSGWIGYTLSWATRRFNDLNNGEVFPFKYDRRHDLNIVYMQKINSKIDFSATWVFATGNAFTMPEAKYEIVSINQYPGSNDLQLKYNNEAYVYSKMNAYRMRNYHRLDIGVNFTKEKKWGERIISLSVYNVYNRKNPYFYFLQTQKQYDENGNPIPGTEKTVVKQQSLFPVIPSISYSFKF